MFRRRPTIPIIGYPCDDDFRLSGIEVELGDLEDLALSAEGPLYACSGPQLKHVAAWTGPSFAAVSRTNHPPLTARG